LYPELHPYPHDGLTVFRGFAWRVDLIRQQELQQEV
jgi:hypothetical protein